MGFIKNKWLRFGIVATLYLLWVIWLGNYWWLPGLIVIFDKYITKKVHWAFWKKKNPPNGKQTPLVEWLDAVIFAVVAATFIRLFFIEAYTIPTSSMEKSMLVGDYLFVSKVSYGPKMPNTPLSVPFVHHTMPFSTDKPSFSTAIQNPYRRIAGFGDVERNDVVVFNFPAGDTVLVNWQAQSYHQIVRDYGRETIQANRRRFGEVVWRPVDKRENYIKRCVAIAGDEIEIKHGTVYVNGTAQEPIAGLQYNYNIITDGTPLNPKALQKMGIALDDMNAAGAARYVMPLTEEKVEKIRAFKSVVSVTKIEESGRSSYIFPHNEQYNWNSDNFGPLWIPKKGVTIDLTLKNLPLYERAIDVYEENDLKVKDGKIYINGEETSTYTFKMDYYWMMGDNRHNSADSRFWGFVPEDHVVGKASFVWLSLDKDKSFPMNIRWDRFLMGVK